MVCALRRIYCQGIFCRFEWCEPNHETTGSKNDSGGGGFSSGAPCIQSIFVLKSPKNDYIASYTVWKVNVSDCRIRTNWRKTLTGLKLGSHSLFSLWSPVWCIPLSQGLPQTLAAGWQKTSLSGWFSREHKMPWDWDGKKSSEAFGRTVRGTCC